MFLNNERQEALFGEGPFGERHNRCSPFTEPATRPARERGFPKCTPLPRRPPPRPPRPSSLSAAASQPAGWTAKANGSFWDGADTSGRDRGVLGDAQAAALMSEDHEGTIVIPDHVRVIADRAFCGFGGMTTLEIPPSVEKIGEEAFRGCRRLRTVLFEPESVVEIGAEAFADCPSLAALELPDSVRTLGPRALAGCIRLTAFALPPKVETVSHHLFEGDHNLVSVGLPLGVTRIEYAAFAGCHRLCELEIPATVTHIGVGAFRDCGIQRIEIPDGVSRAAARVAIDPKMQLWEQGKAVNWASCRPRTAPPRRAFPAVPRRGCVCLAARGFKRSGAGPSPRVPAPPTTRPPAAATAAAVCFRPADRPFSV